MPYTATNNLNDLVETSPPATGTVSADLGPAELETRRTFKAVIMKEHNADGTHSSVNGAVIVAGSVPASALVAGSITSSLITAGTITGTQIAAATITGDNLVNNTITATQVADGILPVGKMLGGGVGGKLWVTQTSGGLSEVAVSGVVTMDQTGAFAFAGSGTQQAVAIFADIETTGTDGGTFTSGAWQTRKLNSTVIDSNSLFNLSANVISVSTPGLYYVKAWSVGYKCDNHQVRLYDPTNSVELAAGCAAFAAQTSPFGETRSELEFVLRLVPSATQSMRLEHQCQTTEASDGLGKNTGFGSNNVFSMVTIIKLA